MIKLFLLKPNFPDLKINLNGQLYYCPHCAMVEGILPYYPHIRKVIEIIYVDFKRPRDIIIDLLGEENQGCPVLIIANNNNDADSSYFKDYGNYKFLNSAILISRYLAERFSIALPHP